MASYYENNASWSAPGRQPSWEQQAPPSRSSTASASRDESAAFSSQFEEIDRASDNLVKSGKFMGSHGLPGPGRRESMPHMMGRPYGAEYDPRTTGPARHHSVSEYDGMRTNSAAGLQGYYANQRFQQQAPPPPRANEAEQMMQAKRRMAAQRERELRNYHQEQQYNRNISGATKPDRSMSPNTGMSEDERRELIARQHRALYGNDSNLYSPDSAANAPAAQRRQSQDVRVGSTSSGGPVGPRGASPFDAFSAQQTAQPGTESVVQMPPRDLQKSPTSTSPSSNPTSFGLIDNAQSSARTSVSSRSGSPPVAQGVKQMSTAAGAVPIGTRPPQPAAVSGLNKQRATTPLPSPLSYGFNAGGENGKTERSASAASNITNADKPISGLGASWASNGSGWGASKNSLGVQASVWG
ncbi:hypothetical protein AAFC00_003949 [Neodothiora populina]|uniref:Uncharacterized protein n=1 Tax=Neodothiora populina TaxID=2781224 RepID=A0ABR3PIE2_9PEZI